jgi:hypothetical protein
MIMNKKLASVVIDVHTDKTSSNLLPTSFYVQTVENFFQFNYFGK